MRILKRDILHPSRADIFEVIPLGDIHIGSAACDETLLKTTIDYIAADPVHRRWIGMGDYCDFINIKDPRFDSTSLAQWITTKALSDLAGAQIERAVSLLKPIASQCLCLVEGNHEAAVRRHYERDVYREIGIAIKQAGGFEQDHNLLIGYTGWMMLTFHRSDEPRGRSYTVKFNLHHGFGGGKLAGGKALNMQRWLWTHDADIIIFGHSHNASSYREAIEMIDKGGKLHLVTKRGLYSGTFMRSNGEGYDTYSERAGYLPLPVGGVMISIRPGAETLEDRIRVIT